MLPMLAVRMQGICRRYYPRGVHANDGASLEVEKGSIHAIVGENGAGKTTLMKILAGLDLPDEGSIEIEGRLVKIESPSKAQALGIGMVHQDFLMFDELSAAENIFFGIEPIRNNKISRLAGIVDSQELNTRAQQLATEYGFAIDPSAPAASLSIGARQQIEILRQLARHTKILILDEPSSVLTEQETRVLFEKLSDIRRLGHTIILVTHKIHEVMQIADRVTIMRQGRTIGTYDISATTLQKLTSLIMGEGSIEEKQEPIEKSQIDKSKIESSKIERSQKNPLVLRVDGLTVRRPRYYGIGLSDISFEVHAGEILGICALSGNGLDDLENALAAFQSPSFGTFIFDGHHIEPHNYRRYQSLFQKGLIAYLPSDRIKRGLASSLSVRDNFIALSRHDFFPKGWILENAAQQAILDAIRSFEINALPDQPAGELSGGNIQKLAIARLFSRDFPKLFILCEPTWSLDIRSAEQTCRRIRLAKEEGTAILLLSSNIDEILELSDHIMVLSRGRRVLYQKNSSLLNRAIIGEYLLGNRIHG